MARIVVLSRSADEGRGFAKLLRGDGHRAFFARSESAAKRLVFAQRAELLVLALPDPAAVMRELARVVGPGIRNTPAIAVVREDEQSALNADVDKETPGLMDLLPTPFSDESFLAHIDALLRVRNVLFERKGLLQDESRRDGGEATHATNAGPWRKLWTLLTEVSPSRRRSRERPLEAYLETAASLVGTVENRDSIDPGHAFRVSAHCASIAGFLELTEEETRMLLYAASVHDIGKIALSKEVLSKPSLTESDRRVLKFHPRRGAELIRALTPYHEAADVVLYHHERPDGRGYYGRKPADIPKLAHVLAAADVYDGMTSSHTARPQLRPEEAVETLLAMRGIGHDADCVDALAASVRPRRASVPVSKTELP